MQTRVPAAAFPRSLPLPPLTSCPPELPFFVCAATGRPAAVASAAQAAQGSALCKARNIRGGASPITAPPPLHSRFQPPFRSRACACWQATRLDSKWVHCALQRAPPCRALVLMPWRPRRMHARPTAVLMMMLAHSPPPPLATPPPCWYHPVVHRAARCALGGAQCALRAGRPCAWGPLPRPALPCAATVCLAYETRVGPRAAARGGGTKQ